MDKIFQRLIGNGLAELNGLTVDATVPVTEDLANEIITASLQENLQLEYARIYIYEGNRIALDVKSPLWPWLIKIKLKLFGTVDITNPPTIRAFLENHALLGRLGGLLHALPDGIYIYKDQISINIEPFMPSQELRKLLGLIHSMEIRTEAGRIFFDVQIRQ